MSDPHQHQGDTYSEAETDARADANLMRMLATPPTPHKPIGERPTRKDKGKARERP